MQLDEHQRPGSIHHDGSHQADERAEVPGAPHESKRSAGHQAMLGVTPHLVVETLHLPAQGRASTEDQGNPPANASVPTTIATARTPHVRWIGSGVDADGTGCRRR